MEFFSVVISVMAISILLIHRLTACFGCQLKYRSLLLCAVLALAVDIAAIRMSPYLTEAHYVRLGAMILVAAAIVTFYNERLLSREPVPAKAGAEPWMAALEAAEEDRAAPFGGMEEGAGEAPSDPPASGDEAPSQESQPVAAMPLPPQLLPAQPGSQPETARPRAELTKGSLPGAARQQAALTSQPASLSGRPEGLSMLSGHPAALPGQSAKLTQAAAGLPGVQAELPGKQAELPEAPARLPGKQAEPPGAPARPPGKQAEPPGAPARLPGKQAEPPGAPAKLPGKQAEPSGAPARQEKPPLPKRAAGQHEAAQRAGQPKAEPVPADVVHAVSRMETLDDILDYAFAQKAQGHAAPAIFAYRQALERYAEDSYAPFIAIDLGNIYKAQAQYDEAIRVYENALDIPAIARNDRAYQEFAKNLSYLRTVQYILSKHNALDTPFPKIPPEYLAEIEADFQTRHSPQIY